MQAIFDRIKQQIENHPLLVYMKGTPEAPQCGFSFHVTQILQECCATYAYVNVLEHPDIRKALPEYADWPTFPQIYLKGELIGGCDILKELFKQGELIDKLAEAGVVAEATEASAAQE